MPMSVYKYIPEVFHVISVLMISTEVDFNLQPKAGLFDRKWLASTI